MDELSKYDFKYPEKLIALDPLEKKHQAKMLISRKKVLLHEKITNLGDYLNTDDLIVFNNSMVLPCRLKAKRNRSQDESSFVDIEVTLNKKEHRNIWSTFCYPGRKLKVGDTLYFAKNFFSTVKAKLNGLYMMEFNKIGQEFESLIRENGEMPIPPYIAKRRGYKSTDFKNYQTPFAKYPGSVAAPTASLHFDKFLLSKLKKKGVRCCFVTLHVSGATFAPIKTNNLNDHIMHSEYARVDLEVVEEIRKTKEKRGRVIAVGTTTMRVLESDGFPIKGEIKAFEKEINTFIKPGHKFKVCSGLLTNFHQPKSTLFVLVNAFIGIDEARDLYQTAVNDNYRLFSYGDCCLLFP